jgi:hypothetical protein
MAKILKRIFTVFMLLVLLVAGCITVLIFSDELATDVAYLECPLIKAAGEVDGASMTFDRAISIWSPVSYARLRKNWIEQRIVLHWVEDENVSEDGLSKPYHLEESTLAYSSYEYSSQRFRSFSRETLIYRHEYREMPTSAATWYFERQCTTISKDIFEAKRLRHAKQTLARQKI